MADINTLLGMGLGPEADMQALADKLRGQQREGQFLGMSTLAPVAQYGQNLQQGAEASAERGGLFRQTAAKNKQAQDNWQSEQNRVASQFTKTQAAAAAKEAQRKLEVNETRDTKSFWHPTLKGTVLNLREGRDGQHYDQDGQVYNPELLTPYKAPTATGSVQKMSKTQEQEKVLKEKRLQGKDFVSRSMTSPYMAGAMGSMADVGKHANKLIGTNPQTGSLQTDLNSMTVTQAAEPLSYLGVNPTDKDLQFALDAVRTLDGQPESWRNWYAGVYNDDIKRAIMASGDLTQDEKLEALVEWEEQLDYVLTEMDENIALEAGKSAEQRLRETGNEEEVIKYKARQKAPTGVNQTDWAELTADQKDKYLNMLTAEAKAG